MNTLKFITNGILLMISSLSSFAQNSKAEEIRRMEQAEMVAMQRLDTIAIQKIWDQDFVVNTPRNQTIVRAEVMTAFKKGLIHYTDMKRETEKITFVDNFAMSMGQETVKPIAGIHAGKTMKRRYTNVWMQRGNTWTLIARQATNICE